MPLVNQKRPASRYNIFRSAASRCATGIGLRGNSSRADALTIDVLIGIPGENVMLATFPYILKGIRERAELEIRERQEVGGIKIDVRYLAPGDFNPETGRQPIFRNGHKGERRGTIVIYPFAESAVEMISRRTPTVSVLENYSSLGIDSIDTDDTTAISELVGRLYSLGHTRIGFLSWHYPVRGHWLERRYSGYLRGLGAHGLKSSREWAHNVHAGGPHLPPGEAARAIAANMRDSGVTACVCAADHQAYRLVQDLEALGLRVPTDFSVTGFDGLEAPFGLPRATSMRVPHEHIGSSALTRMINRVMYPSSLPRKILVGAQLVPGETTAPPRRR